MKTKIDFGSSIAGIEDQPKPGRPIPGPERPLGARPSPKTGKDAPETPERVTDVPTAIHNILSGVIPDKHLPMAVEDFQKKFPHVTDVAQIKGIDFFGWIDTLPIVNSVKIV